MIPTIWLLASPPSIASTEALINFFANLGAEGPDQAGERAVGDAVREGFAENFASESAGGRAWAPLAPFTVAERKRLGYGGSHPILVRTGSYRSSLVNAADPEHVAQFGATAGRWLWQFGSRDFRFPEHEGGKPNMPARPAAVLSQAAAERLGSVLDKLFDDMEPSNG